MLIPFRPVNDDQLETRERVTDALRQLADVLNDLLGSTSPAGAPPLVFSGHRTSNALWEALLQVTRAYSGSLQDMPFAGLRSGGRFVF